MIAELTSELNGRVDVRVASATEAVGLLSPTVTHYVVKEKWWDWGGGDIVNHEGQTLGKMHRRVISMRALVEVADVSGALVFTVHKKLVSMRPSYMIQDADGQVLGRTNRKLLTLFRPKLWLEDASGHQLVEASGNFLGKRFDLKDKNGTPKATVGKSDFFKDLVFGGLFDFADTYVVHVVDPHYDKRLLLGFVIAIDNSVHDK